MNNKLKYLGESLETNVSEEVALTALTRKMEYCKAQRSDVNVCKIWNELMEKKIVIRK